MGTARITKRLVEGCSLPDDGKRIHIWDDKLKGFGVMITSKGARSYVVQYRMGGRGHNTQTITIGRHGSPWTAEKARERATDILEQVRKGIDPRKAEADARRRDEDEKHVREVLAFDTYSELFVLRHAVALELRTTDDLRAVLRRDLVPRFGKKPLTELSRSDITRCLEEIADRSGSASNKAHKWLKKMLNFAVDRGDLASSPMERMRPPHRGRKGDRTLNESEIKLVWKACERIGYPFGTFTQVLLLTGQRLREIGEMRWDEIDNDLQECVIPGTRTKNGNDHLIPLGYLASDILFKIRDMGPEGNFVFTTNGTTPISGYSKSKALLDKVITELNGGASIPPWARHDLRRTVATGCQALGIPIDHTEALLNHTGRRAGLVGVYQLHQYRPEKAAAIERWNRRVGELCGLPLSIDGSTAPDNEQCQH
jgi:integrase